MVAYPRPSVLKHLEKDSCDINYDIPAQNFHGSAAMDWEHWRPLWDCNWDKRRCLQENVQKINLMEENISAADVEHLARLSFEERQNLLWGNNCIKNRKQDRGLVGILFIPLPSQLQFLWSELHWLLPREWSSEENKLSWLWDKNASFYPFTGIDKCLGNTKIFLHFSQLRADESIRIFSITSQSYAFSIFVHSWLDYREKPLLFLFVVSSRWNTVGFIYVLTILADGTLRWKTSILSQLC